MLIGAMNHPNADVLEEIQWMARMGLEFLDLTLEPPAAAAWRVDVDGIRKALEKHRMPAVGHTAYYLPLASPFDAIRDAAVAETVRCIEVFARVGVKWMNVHPDRHAPMHNRAFYIKRNLESLRELIDHGQRSGVGIMVENTPGDFNNATQLGELLDPLPELGLHLDIGHCNLLTPTNTAEELIRKYPQRLKHVHLHDNKGGSADLHLPLGTGTIDLKRQVRTLKSVGYDATITLEVFSPDRRHLAFSRDLLREAWDGV